MKISGDNHLGSDENADSVAKGKDFFDQLPDDILLDIFNKTLDAKSLVRCLSVSKRCNALVPQVESIHLPLPRHRVVAPPTTKPTKLFKTLVRFLQNIVTSGKQRNDSKRRTVVYHSPNEVLKGFKQLKSLHLELPCFEGDVGLAGKDSLLKWKAEFGASLKSCVILGANSVRKEPGVVNDGKEEEKVNDSNRSALSDDELKTRIVWMISSLIAAASRHYLTKRVASCFPSLESVVVSDGDRRGRVEIGGAELGELRAGCAPAPAGMEVESSLERSLIPDLGMKLWHVPRMVLPKCGVVMEGATLVVIRPLRGPGSDGRNEEVLTGAGFDGDEEEEKILGEALREIVNMKRTCVMEMTSF